MTSLIPMISVFTVMFSVFSLENSTCSGTDTYLLRTNFFGVTYRHYYEYVSGVRFSACTANLVLRSFTHPFLLSNLQQTPFTKNSLVLPLNTKDLTQHNLWSSCFTLTVSVESHIPIISLFTTMSPVFSLENSTFSGTDTYLLLTNFVAAT